MAYTIVKSNGTVLTTIADGTINTTSTSLGLPGRNYAGYGQSLDTNFVHMVENFASTTPPSNPLQGQLWYNTNANTLYICPTDGESNGAAWLALTSTASGGTTTFGNVTITGNITATGQLNVTNGVYSSNNFTGSYADGIVMDYVNGQGRMEYTELDLNKKNWNATEIYRHRIPTPAPDTSYCEKNWVPVLDKPFHFVKWSMPTEVVWANPETPETKTVKLSQTPSAPRDQRGGSPIVKWGDYYIAVTHEVWLWYNYLKQKDSIYRHRVVVWDKDFNFIGLSPENISFLEAPIEFCIGAAVYEGDLLLGIGVQDNCAFVLRVPTPVIVEFLD